MRPDAQGWRAGRAGGHARAWGRALAVGCLPVLLALGAARAAGEAPSVETDKGTVIGKTLGSTAQFLGIPYAAPPAGALRFRPPQPCEAWSRPLQATQFGNPCPQTARLGSPSTNEDCLYLNGSGRTGLPALG
jgi:para-nitrobenzyl esterase